MEKSEVLDLLRESDALLEGHFELSSGLHSNRYFQCALGLCDPKRAEIFANGLAAKLPYEVDLVVGPALGAVVWAQEVARALGKPAFFTMPECQPVPITSSRKGHPYSFPLMVHSSRMEGMMSLRTSRGM